MAGLRGFIRPYGPLREEPVSSRQIETAQRNWIACRDATEEAYGLCLKGGEENEPEDEWFRANITRLQLDFIEPAAPFWKSFWIPFKLNDL